MISGGECDIHIQDIILDDFTIINRNIYIYIYYIGNVPFNLGYQAELSQVGDASTSVWMKSLDKFKS